MSEGPGRGDPGEDAVRVGGGFDLSHLQAVHRRLFDGVDPDAGRLRTVDPPHPAGPHGPPGGEVVMAVPARYIRTAGGKGAGRKRREVHALADTLREVADQLRPPTDPAPRG